MKLTKASLIIHLRKKQGLSKGQATQLVDLFFDECKQQLANGVELKLAGFGNFSVREKHNRFGRNPQTGQKLMIKKRRVVTFKAGQKLRSRVEKSVQ